MNKKGRSSPALANKRREQIKHLYAVDLLSVIVIAKLLNMSDSAVSWHLRKLGITRTPSEAMTLAYSTGRKRVLLDKFPRGENQWNWHGGRSKTYHGYISILTHNHPYSTYNRVLEHRLVMEKYLGRYLLPNEIVHHINGVKDDNRIENLSLTQSKKTHSLLHPNITCPHCHKSFILVTSKPMVAFL